MIPEAAVEAAARKRRALSGFDWDNMNLPPSVEISLKAHLLAEEREILEAAAPHMLAGAWAEGCEAGYSGWDNYKDISDVENPYRPTP